MKSAADYQRHYRERKKAAEAEKALALADKIFIEPFFPELESSDLPEIFDMMGMSFPDMLDDSDPASYTGEIERALSFNADSGLGGFAGHKRSLGRAEVMMNALHLAAGELARIIAAYKMKEIRARISEIEDSALTGSARKNALADLVRLHQMLDQLSEKQVKWTLPQWQATG